MRLLKSILFTLSPFLFLAFCWYAFHIIDKGDGVKYRRQIVSLEAQVVSFDELKGKLVREINERETCERLFAEVRTEREHLQTVLDELPAESFVDGYSPADAENDSPADGVQ